MRSILIPIFILILATTVSAQDKQPDSVPPRAQKIKELFLKQKDSFEAKLLNKDTLVSQARRLSDEQFKTMLLLELQKQKQIEDENFAMQHRWRSFNFQYAASIIIFSLVILIVLCGLFFSGWQFSFTLKQIKLKEALLQLGREQVAPTPQPQNQAAGGQEPPVPVVAETGTPKDIGPDISSLKSELELSTTGIKANSSVLGVIILALSIAFFYLYIIYVYPIKYLTPSPQENKAESTISKDK